MPRAVEGYVAPHGHQQRQGAQSWVDGMRADLRRRAIHRMARERIENGGRSRFQPSNGGWLGKFGEVVLFGVTVALASQWVCKLWGPSSQCRKCGHEE